MRNLFNLLIALILVSITFSCQKDEFFEEEFAPLEDSIITDHEQADLSINPEEVVEGITLERAPKSSDRSEEEVIFESDRVNLDKGKFHLIYASRNFLVRNSDCSLQAQVARTITVGNPDLGIFAYDQSRRDYRLIRSSTLSGNAIDEASFSLEDLRNHESHIAIAVKAQSSTQFILKVMRDCGEQALFDHCLVTEVFNHESRFGRRETIIHNEKGMPIRIATFVGSHLLNEAHITYNNTGEWIAIEKENTSFHKDDTSILQYHDGEVTAIHELNEADQVIVSRHFSQSDNYSSTTEFTYIDNFLVKSKTTDIFDDEEYYLETEYKYDHDIKNPFEYMPLIAFLTISRGAISTNAVAENFISSLNGSRRTKEWNFELNDRGLPLTKEHTYENGRVGGYSYTYECP